MQARFVLTCASLCAIATLFAGCASDALRYTDASGRQYDGEVERLRNSITARIDGRLYRGPFNVNDWGQGKATLASPGRDPLYCELYFQGMKVKGKCTDLAGGDYVVQSR